MATAFLPGVIALPARHRGGCGAAKRARDGDLPAVLQEADARGWSSSVLDRSLALRRRRGPPCSSPNNRGCGWATGDERGLRCEEAATPDAVAAGAAAEETAAVDPSSCIAYCSKRDLPGFDSPPMATPLLPLCVFIADLWKARNDGRVDKGARELIAAPEEAATPC